MPDSGVAARYELEPRDPSSTRVGNPPERPMIAARSPRYATSSCWLASASFTAGPAPLKRPTYFDALWFKRLFQAVANIGQPQRSADKRLAARALIRQPDADFRRFRLLCLRSIPSAATVNSTSPALLNRPNQPR